VVGNQEKSWIPCNTTGLRGIVVGVRVTGNPRLRREPGVGVRAGLEALFDVEYEAMYRLAFAMLGVDHDAEEVVQDGFVGLAARWGSVDNPGGYLRVSVVNGARKRMRSRDRRTTAEDSIRATATEGSPNSGEYLLDVLDRLPDRQQAAVVLTYYSGFNSTEVGEILQCPAATVRSLLRRALKQLRTEVER
jgi:RNA polymerase sigma factor (sigma-70 family)